MLSTLLRRMSDVEQWVNTSTAEVDSWLRAPGVETITERLVSAWCAGGGLAVELADELCDLVQTRLAQDHPRWWTTWKLRRVNWNQLAEQYALRFCGMTEDDLTARRENLLLTR